MNTTLSNTEKVQHEKSTTRKKFSLKREQDGKSTTLKECNSKKVQRDQITIWRNTKKIKHKKSAT